MYVSSHHGREMKIKYVSQNALRNLDFISTFLWGGRRLYNLFTEFLNELLFHSFFYGAIEVSVMKD